MEKKRLTPGPCVPGAPRSPTPPSIPGCPFGPFGPGSPLMISMGRSAKKSRETLMRIVEK